MLEKRITLEDIRKDIERLGQQLANYHQITIHGIPTYPNLKEMSKDIVLENDLPWSKNANLAERVGFLYSSLGKVVSASFDGYDEIARDYAAEAFKRFLAIMYFLNVDLDDIV